MLMKAKGYKAGYLNEYLAIGEAPEEVRNVFRQRSRWCKGQMQVIGRAGGCTDALDTVMLQDLGRLTCTGRSLH
jgi:cellulose synthase/poly-beta-1,6-N-acetylglucosamine synthase-like glycosyltransferase